MTARDALPPNPPVARTSRGRILLIEGDANVARGVRVALERFGYSIVAWSVDPSEGALLARALRPQLVVSAVFFDGDPLGIESAREIQEETGTPVVLIGGSDEPLLALQLTMMQPAGFVTDPADAGYLVAVVEQAMRSAGRVGAGGPY